MTLRLTSMYPDGTQMLDGLDIPFTSLNVVLVESGIGVLEIEIPTDYCPRGLSKDYRFHVYRSPYGGPEYLEGNAVFLVRSKETTEESNGNRTTSIKAYHANNLLKRRIIAAGSGTSGATKTGKSDDILKQFVTENFVSASDTTRNSSLISVEANTSLGATISVDLEWQELFDAFIEICNVSKAGGIYQGFEVSPNGKGFLFRTFIGQRGVDRRFSSGNWLPLGAQYRNVVSLRILEDWTNAATVSYELGPGEGSLRQVIALQRSADELGSSFGRIEVAASGSARDVSELGSAALASLEEARYRVEVDATLLDTPTCIYGRDYNWGDRVTLETSIGLFDCIVDPVRITAQPSASESIEAKLSFRG